MSGLVNAYVLFRSAVAQIYCLVFKSLITSRNFAANVTIIFPRLK